MSTSANALLHTLRTDQVGSLLRPAWLKEVYTRHGAGQASDQELRDAQEKAISDVITKQEAHGVQVLTDGEYRRLNFQDSFGASVQGFASDRDSIQFHEQRTSGGTPGQKWDPGYTGQGPAITLRRPAKSRLRLARNQPLEEYRYSSSVASRPVKITLIGPDRIIQRFEYENSRDVYADLDEFVADVVSIERQIIQGLIDAGCRYVQIDAPSYTAYVDPPSLEQMRARGEDPAKNMERSIAADNAVIAGLENATLGIHLCRGNQRSMWHRQGTYDAIAEKLFGSLGHTRFLLEYDTERAGGFEPLRFVPRGKIVVLGLVSTKTAQVETREQLLRRIEEATKYLPLEQLALSPQCGFASDIVGNLLSEDDQWRKLEVIQEVATEVWGQQST